MHCIAAVTSMRVSADAKTYLYQSVQHYFKGRSLRYEALILRTRRGDSVMLHGQCFFAKRTQFCFIATYARRSFLPPKRFFDDGSQGRGTLIIPKTDSIQYTRHPRVTILTHVYLTNVHLTHVYFRRENFREHKNFRTFAVEHIPGDRLRDCIKLTACFLWSLLVVKKCRHS